MRPHIICDLVAARSRLDLLHSALPVAIDHPPDSMTTHIRGEKLSQMIAGPYSSTMDREALSKQVLEMGWGQGFALVGVSDAAASPHAAYVRGWIREGFHGEMDYLERHLDIRLDPGKLLESARSVICVADRYPAEPENDWPGEHQGRVARYAWGDDYHKVLKKRLHTMADRLAGAYPQARFKSVVDTAPVMEREHAVRAGLGWIGKHTLMLHPHLGSWFLLGNIVTTLDLATSQALDYPDPTVAPADHCGTCTRCIDACPTDAIAPEGYQLDATRCISYLTLEHRSEIDPALQVSMGDWIAGCDICQQVCPYNIKHDQDFGKAQDRGKTQQVALPVHPRYEPRNKAFSLDQVLQWDEQARREAFQGSALKRMKLDMVKRNALIAAGNALMQEDQPSLRQRIEALREDEREPALVRDTARQVLVRINP